MRFYAAAAECTNVGIALREKLVNLFFLFFVVSRLQCRVAKTEWCESCPSAFECQRKVLRLVGRQSLERSKAAADKHKQIIKFEYAMGF